MFVYLDLGFPGGSVVKNPPAGAKDADLIPRLGRSLELLLLFSYSVMSDSL